MWNGAITDHWLPVTLCYDVQRGKWRLAHPKETTREFRSTECNYPRWNHPRTPKANSKGGWIEKHCSSTAGQATMFLTRLVLLLFVCLCFANTADQGLVTGTGNGVCRHLIKIGPSDLLTDILHSSAIWQVKEDTVRICFKIPCSCWPDFQEDSDSQPLLHLRGTHDWAMANGM